MADFGHTPAASELPLGLCEGDCESNYDCEGDLICFHRQGLKPIPGCLGDGVSGHDYCVTPAPKLLNNFNKDPDFPLGLCQGDCDRNSNSCEGDLTCFQRDGYAPVPGCFGDGRK